MFLEQPADCIQIHNPGNLDQLVNDLDDDQNLILQSLGHSKLSSKSNVDSCEPGADQKEINVSTTESKMAPSTAASNTWLGTCVLQYIQEEKEEERKWLESICQPLLEMEKTLVTEADEELNYHDYKEIRRWELLHRKWTKQVYEPLKRKLDFLIKQQDWLKVERINLERYKHYIEYVNQKGYAMLDTLDPKEYYSEALIHCHPLPSKIRTKIFDDPLLHHQMEQNKEDKIILRCATGINFSDKDLEQFRLPPLPLNPRGRHGTECKTWLAMPFDNIESTPRVASRRRADRNRNQSQLISKAETSQPIEDIVNEEMAVQKKSRWLFQNKGDRQHPHTGRLTSLLKPPAAPPLRY